MEEKIAKLMAAAARIDALTTALHGAALVGFDMSPTRTLLHNSCYDFDRMAAELVPPVPETVPPNGPEPVAEAQV